jgi:hypothetical protein
MTKPDATEEWIRIQANIVSGKVMDTESSTTCEVDYAEAGIRHGMALERARVCRELREWIEGRKFHATDGTDWMGAVHVDDLLFKLTEMERGK